VSIVRRVAVIAAIAVLAGCNAFAQPSPSPNLTPLTVGLGYIPSVQFAPFYLAQQDGFYREAGLEVTFQNKIDPDLVALVGQGAVDVGLADGTSVIPAVSQGIPIRYIASVYRAFPSVVFGKADSGIETAADLEGRTLGIPGRFGSSWIMLQALLRSADLTPDDLEIRDYPDFGQGVAVQEDQVDVATGFINNEPVQLALTGTEAVVLTVDDIVPLPGPGLIAGTQTLATKPEALRGFVAATLRAMEAIAADPARGLDASEAAVPDLAQSRPTQEAILEATIDAWRGDGGGGFGAIDPADWEASIAFLTELELVPEPISPSDTVDSSFLPSQ
jgi:NitT/TauT family transport system substrate-binding protein